MEYPKLKIEYKATETEKATTTPPNPTSSGKRKAEASPAMEGNIDKRAATQQKMLQVLPAEDFFTGSSAGWSDENLIQELQRRHLYWETIIAPEIWLQLQTIEDFLSDDILWLVGDGRPVPEDAYNDEAAWRDREKLMSQRGFGTAMRAAGWQDCEDDSDDELFAQKWHRVGKGGCRCCNRVGKKKEEQEQQQVMENLQEAEE